jgi:DNA-binding transcriptional ArsR family regulator
MAFVAKITLDADTFRALASSTRLTVLKALDERRKTLTELSRDLALNKATVHEHLQLLTAAGLVRKRDDEGRKWIYYELTWTGQRILHPEATTTFSLLLGLSVAAAGGGIAMLGRALGWWLADNRSAGGQEFDMLSAPEGTSEGASTAADAPSDPEAGEGANRDFAMEQPAADDGSGLSFLDDGGWLALALLATCALFLVLGWAVRRKLRPEPFDPDAASAAEASGAA